MSEEAIAFNEHVFVSALISFFHVSSPTLALVLLALVVLSGIIGTAGIFVSVRRISSYISARQTTRQANKAEGKGKARADTDVEANAGKETMCPPLASAKVNGITEKEMMEFMSPAVAESYVRLTGRRQPIIPSNSSVSSWYGSVTTKTESFILPGNAAVELERSGSASSNGSNGSWTSSEAYRFVNGCAMSVGNSSNKVSRSDGGSTKSRVSSLGSYVEGNGSFIVNHNFRFPPRRYSNNPGDSHFNISPTSSEYLSFASQSSSSLQESIHEAITPQYPVDPRRSPTRPRPVTWHAPASAEVTMPCGHRGAKIVLPVEHHPRMSMIEGVAVQITTEKMIAIPAEVHYEIEKQQRMEIPNEIKEVLGGDDNIGGQRSGAASVQVQTAPAENEMKATSTQSEVPAEADLADGDLDGMYEDVFITSIGEKLGKKGFEMLGKDVVLRDRTNVFAERTNTISGNGDGTGDGNDENSMKVPRLVLIPATDVAPWRKSGFKRHRQLRPKQLGY